VEKLRTPITVKAIYLFLLGLSTISPALAGSIFGGEIKDPGLLRILSGVFFGIGVIDWGIANNTEKYGGLASALVIALLISAVFLAWTLVTGLNPARAVLVPLIINVVLAGWIWSAKPKS